MIKKTVLLKVFTTQIRSTQISSDPIQKRTPARSVQLEVLYLEALLYSDIFQEIKTYTFFEDTG